MPVPDRIALRPDRAQTLVPVDPRFRALLTAEQWARLPPPIRKRFSRCLSAGQSVTYRGRIVEARMSRASAWLSQIARLAGGPLPLSRDIRVAAVVTVTEDVAANGQHWTRLYGRRGRFPQVIHSSKRFAGPTGLEEYIGCGLVMALTVEALPDALVFHSAGFSLDLGLFRLTLPRWLSPGALTVTHSEIGGGHFEFVLQIVHPRLGEIIRQTAAFEETAP